MIRRILYTSSAVFLILLSFSGCVTTPAKRDPLPRALEVLTSGDPEFLTEASFSRLIIDSEIIVSPSMIKLYWTAFANENFIFDQESFLYRDAEASDSLLFNSTFEVREYLNLLVKNESFMVIAKSDNGMRFYILMTVDSRDSELRIAGVRGPLK